jgi:Kef-type K+ transport system membrane component KefB
MTVRNRRATMVRMSLSFAGAFHEVAALVLAAAIVGALAVRLRQPLIVAFIAVGVLAGPSVLDVVRAEDEIHLLAQLGIALVLFVVGLKLDVRVIRDTGTVALTTGVVQIGFTAVVGFGLALLLGLEAATAAYVAMALTFSSTIIVVKLLSDRREIDELHGRIAVGILIVQDLVVIGAIIALTAIGADSDGSVVQQVAWVVIKGVALLVGLGLVTRYALTAMLHRAARTPELLVLGAIAWAVGLAALADALGFSSEVGAFLGGVALASTPYREAIGGRLVPLRDFLLLFFFLDLGANLDLGSLAGQLVTAFVLSAFVLIGKPLVVVAVTGRLGYTSRVGFLAGVSLSQISEFSLILAALGLGLGHLDSDGVALITAIALITIVLSTYATLYGRELHERLRRPLALLERRGGRPLRDEPGVSGERVDVIVCGAGRFGGALLGPLRDAGHRVLAVDFDPRVLAAARADGHLALYGDAEDPELPAALPLEGVLSVVCTVRRLDVGRALLRALDHHGYTGRLVLSAHHAEDAEELRALGADHVLRPYEAAAAEAVAALTTPPRTAAGHRPAPTPSAREIDIRQESYG